MNTSRKIQNYLHFYLGAEIQIEYGYPDSKKIGILTGFRAGAGWEIWPHKESWVRIPKGERVIPAIVRDDLVKPILRPLSDMTEEEKIEVANIFGWTWSDDVYKVNQVDQLFETNGFYNKQTNITGNNWCKAFRYLLSRGIDLFGLIDDDLAIDKTKQPQPPKQ